MGFSKSEAQAEPGFSNFNNYDDSIIGVIANHEGVCGVDSLTISASRESVVDFTIPYSYERTQIYSRTPEIVNPALAITRSFSLSVWLAILASLLIISISSAVMINLPLQVTHENNETLKMYNLLFRSCSHFLEYSRIMLVQDNFLKNKRNVLTILLVTWYTFSLIINTAFSGSLTAALAAPTYEPQIDYLQDILSACTKGEANFLLYKDSSTDQRIKNAESGTIKDLNRCVNEDTSYLPSTDNFMDEIQSGNGIGIMSEHFFTTLAYDRGLQNFHIGAETINIQSQGIALPTGSPLKPMFDKRLRIIFESGMIYHFLRSEFRNLFSVKIFQHLDGKKKKNGRRITISIIHLQGAFILLCLGYIVGLLVFILENIQVYNKVVCSK